MKKLILIVTVCFFAIFTSCTDQLRIDERQTNFDAKYFSYSKYQLTTAIAKTAKAYAKGNVDTKLGETAWYFINCYSSDQLLGFTSAASYWENGSGGNPYAVSNESDLSNGVFRTLKALEDLAIKENNKANLAAAQVLFCVNMAYLTEKYGDVPFTTANEGRDGDVFPKFDSQKSIYEAMFTKLDEAAVIFADASSTGLPSDQDILFKGDKAKWLKFANSLKFRLMMHSYNAFKTAGTDLASKLQDIASGGKYMSVAADNAAMPFPGLSSDDSWFLNTTYNSQNGFTQFKPTKSLVDKLVALDDPRLYVIFAPVLTPATAAATASSETVKINGFSYTINHDPAVTSSRPNGIPAENSFDDNGNAISVAYPLDAMWFGTPRTANINNIYAGSGLAGGNSSYDNRRLTGLATFFTKVSDARLTLTLMESSEMLFLLAEARQKGLISAGTVKDYYEAGIKQSFTRWQITDGTKPASYIGSTSIVANYNDYCALAGVKLDGTSADLDKIYLQKWFANLLTNHTEEYTEIRRTGKPAFAMTLPPKFSTIAYPYRYLYPFDEKNNNKTNYDAAASAIGGDLAVTKMWIFK